MFDVQMQRLFCIIAIMLSIFASIAQAATCVATIHRRAVDLFDPDNTTPIIGSDEQSAAVTIAGFFMIGIFGVGLIWLIYCCIWKKGWFRRFWNFVSRPYKALGTRYRLRKARGAAAEYTASIERDYTGRANGQNHPEINQPLPVYDPYSR